MYEFVIKTQIEIDCSIDKAWYILTDFDKYGEWNPFIKKVHLYKNFDIGKKIKLFIKISENNDKLKRYRVKIYNIEKYKCISWGDNMYLGALKTVKNQQFEHSNNNVLYKIEHKFSGPLAKKLKSMYGKKLEERYKEMCFKFKGRCEQLYS